MDEKFGCDICGEIPLEYELDSHHIRNSLVKRGIRKWLLCDECIVIVDSFVNNLQALRPNKIVDNWPIPEDIADAADATAHERRERIEKKPKKHAYIRKDEFDEWKELVSGIMDELKKNQEVQKGIQANIQRLIELQNIKLH